MKIENINEDLNRIKLLMNYSPKNTLTENTLTTNKVTLNEQSRLVRALTGAGEKVALKELDELLKKGTKLELEGGVAIKNAQEALDALKYGKLSSKSLTTVVKNFVTSTKPELVKAGSEALAETKTLQKMRADGKNIDEIVSELRSKGGYNQYAAEEIAKAVMRKSTGEIIRTGWRGTKATAKWLTNKPWKRFVLLAGSLYAAYKIWWEQEDDLGDCLKGYVDSPEKFDKYLDDGFIIVGQYKLWQDKTAEITTATGTEEKGTWKDGGDKIIVTVAGVEKTVPCGSSSEIPSDTGTTEDGGVTPLPVTGTYKPCEGNYVIGCFSETIREVQTCLGNLVPDGKFGPKTQAALDEVGFGGGFKDSDVDTICSASTMPEPDLDLPTPDDEDIDLLNM